MRKIIALADYKNRFGSKHFDSPYRIGMDKALLLQCFKNMGFEIEFKQFTEVINKSYINTSAVYIYTSSEDERYLYKNFIEDVVLFLEESGCKVIPSYKYLRANNNKVFMEMLRNLTNDRDLLSIQSHTFGVKEELNNIVDELHYPIILKTSEGASGRGVFKAESKKQLLKIVNKISSSKNFFSDLKEIGRTFKHKGYLKESSYRKKFIIQNMIENLENDWKVYFFYDKLYVFFRPIFKHREFRASGGGYDNYKYDEDAPKPDGFFDFVKKIVEHFDVPHASLDIAYDGKNFHLIEMQFLYFGTAGIPYSKGYYEEKGNEWIFCANKYSIEEVYANSITKYINAKLT
jgi:glutathione synthase/RimK-type ligase-like ATP-grasp enzyme